MTPAQRANEPTSLGEAVNQSARRAATSNRAASPKPAFFRHGPWDRQFKVLADYPIYWRVPVVRSWWEVLDEDVDIDELGSTYEVALYERTEITYRGAVVYIYRGSEDH
jgi:hypothetical protein